MRACRATICLAPARKPEGKEQACRELGAELRLRQGHFDRRIEGHAKQTVPSLSQVVAFRFEAADSDHGQAVVRDASNPEHPKTRYLHSVFGSEDRLKIS